jgi:hypothetical protein
MTRLGIYKSRSVNPGARHRRRQAYVTSWVN